MGTWSVVMMASSDCTLLLKEYWGYHVKSVELFLELDVRLHLYLNLYAVYLLTFTKAVPIITPLSYVFVISLLIYELYIILNIIFVFSLQLHHHS